MILTILSISLSIVFLILGAVHFYWVMGGEWGFDKAIPTRQNGEKVFNPKKFDSAVVGVGLTLFSVFYLLKSELLNVHAPSWIFTYIGWIIPIIFILRAMGDFNYVGFFKKLKSTEFAKSDSKLFSPLCLMIGLIGIFLQLAK